MIHIKINLTYCNIFFVIGGLSSYMNHIQDGLKSAKPIHYNLLIYRTQNHYILEELLLSILISCISYRPYWIYSSTSTLIANVQKFGKVTDAQFLKVFSHKPIEIESQFESPQYQPLKTITKNETTARQIQILQVELYFLFEKLSIFLNFYSICVVSIRILTMELKIEQERYIESGDLCHLNKTSGYFIREIALRR